MPAKKITQSPAIEPAPSTPAPTGKLAAMVALLRREQGVTLLELMDATGWQAHSVRGALAGALKKRGLVIASVKVEKVRTYRAAS